MKRRGCRERGEDERERGKMREGDREGEKDGGSEREMEGGRQ